MTVTNQLQKRVKKLEQAFTPKLPQNEGVDLLKRREQIFESLTKGMTPEEKTKFELAAIEELTNSEEFLKLLRDCQKQPQNC